MGVADFTGIGGNFRVESVAGLPWNGWQLCYGISGRIRLEYAEGIKPVFLFKINSFNQCKAVEKLG
jgi:hypothetical protein